MPTMAKPDAVGVCQLCYNTTCIRERGSVYTAAPPCRLLHTFTQLLSYTSRFRSPYPTSLIMHTKKAPHLRFGSRCCCSLVLLSICMPQREGRQRLCRLFKLFFYNILFNISPSIILSSLMLQFRTQR